MPHSVFIKSMVCTRCKLVVTQLFKDFNIPLTDVQLGEVILEREMTEEELPLVRERLEQFGFELIHDNRAKIAMKVKTLLIELLESDSFDLKLKLSSYLAEKLGYEYHYLSNLFSEVEGTTIEKYFIQLKIEKVKELIDYGQYSLNEISFRLGYSSPAHLTNQFKSITGITPSHYKSINTINRKPLDKL
ncbi:MAG: AraC family transcriptional reguator [Bacteroidetes bacterium]|nr:AraC family transcriptional reguator [Bacteroidota bacterium]